MTPHGARNFLGTAVGGTARDGKTYANTYAWFLDLRDGKIVKAFAFIDSVVFNEFWQRVKP
jgi:ketosteroid isomerase-like protein